MQESCIAPVSLFVTTWLALLLHHTLTSSPTPGLVLCHVNTARLTKPSPILELASKTSTTGIVLQSSPTPGLALWPLYDLWKSTLVYLQRCDVKEEAYMALQDALCVFIYR